MNTLEGKLYTVEEYFALVEELDKKIEYHAGHIYDLAGGTSNHSIIANNIRRRLSEKLDTTDCVVYDSDMQLAIQSEQRYLYPDAMVVCGERIFEDSKQLRITNPILIIEVLSENTQGHDKTDKFRFYRSIPTFKEYLLIDSQKPVIDSYFKEDKSLWRISSAVGIDASIQIHSIGIEIALKDIYVKTEGLKNPEEI